ncbi:hypothetical protein [Thiomicrospira pelophila]|uniref:hypothetical protein n=1 Tax=Thiomicrospira pelophila TaxID=934 RepID=UPI0004A756AC|nr:hypothetical protein [Thiomicrospira pelophila]
MKFSSILIGLLSLVLLSACQNKPDIQSWPLIEDCDLHQQTCQAQQGNSIASLSIQPQPIPLAKPFQIEVQLNNLEAQTLELDISGINMYMGYNRVTLKADPAQPGRFTGSSMLAFCTNEMMEWQISLLLQQADGTLLQIPFKLVTRNR